MILVLMGVSGVGKTVIGALLSARTGWKFEDADDYHSEESRRKMAAGIPTAARGFWHCMRACCGIFEKVKALFWRARH
jgi:gluconokinase